MNKKEEEEEEEEEAAFIFINCYFILLAISTSQSKPFLNLREL
ncbi:hypothetical protein ACMBCN_03455 [Candidatus Liberibacter asiaticus]